MYRISSYSVFNCKLLKQIIMKKNYFTLVAVVLLVLLASCQKEEVEEVTLEQYRENLKVEGYDLVFSEWNGQNHWEVWHNPMHPTSINTETWPDSTENLLVIRSTENNPFLKASRKTSSDFFKWSRIGLTDLSSTARNYRTYRLKIKNTSFNPDVKESFVHYKE
ncbi:MAG: hypothetical protein JXR30_01965, partial [Alphaproteobacteria bacterium]|nr:hypothetical protein [Alphaproteobacteria bacterium]